MPGYVADLIIAGKDEPTIQTEVLWKVLRCALNTQCSAANTSAYNPYREALSDSQLCTMTSGTSKLTIFDSTTSLAYQAVYQQWIKDMVSIAKTMKADPKRKEFIRERIFDMADVALTRKSMQRFINQYKKNLNKSDYLCVKPLLKKIINTKYLAVNWKKIR